MLWKHFASVMLASDLMWFFIITTSHAPNTLESRTARIARVNSITTATDLNRGERGSFPAPSKEPLLTADTSGRRTSEIVPVPASIVND